MAISIFLPKKKEENKPQIINIITHVSAGGCQGKMKVQWLAWDDSDEQLWINSNTQWEANILKDAFGTEADLPH